jgi:hypothetical protein
MFTCFLLQTITLNDDVLHRLQRISNVLNRADRFYRLFQLSYIITTLLVVVAVILLTELYLVNRHVSDCIVFIVDNYNLAIVRILPMRKSLINKKNKC